MTDLEACQHTAGVLSSIIPLPSGPMTRQKLQRMKRKVRTLYGGGLMTIAMTFCVGSILWSHMMSSPSTTNGLDVVSTDTNTAAAIAARRFLPSSTEGRQLQNMTLLPKCNELLMNYPKEVFTWKEKGQGAVVLYVLGVLYMFVALAIVCDEFFVPALECIVDTAGISDDVGACFFFSSSFFINFFFNLVLDRG